MYDAIVDLDGASTQQLSSRMELPTSVVVEQGRRLVRLGLVRFTQAGQERVWRATSATPSRTSSTTGSPKTFSGSGLWAALHGAGKNAP
jgi:hypothetical protein